MRKRSVYTRHRLGMAALTTTAVLAIPGTPASVFAQQLAPVTHLDLHVTSAMLTQAAQHVAEHPGPLGAFYRRLKKRKARNVAIVATARKLVTIAFLMLKNFFVVKRYNAADSYALAVGLLADEIAGYGGVQGNWPRPSGTLGIKEKVELPSRMTELGYYDGEVDGNFGSGSKAAISAIQKRLGMQQSGEPSQRLLEALR